MIEYKTLLRHLLLITSLLLPWATTGAVEAFEQMGAITRIDYKSFTVNRRDFRIAPGAKLNSADSSRRSFSDFKTGDVIFFKGKIVNDVYYVDIIFYEKPEPS